MTRAPFTLGLVTFIPQAVHPIGLSYCFLHLALCTAPVANMGLSFWSTNLGLACPMWESTYFQNSSSLGGSTSANTLGNFTWHFSLSIASCLLPRVTDFSLPFTPPVWTPALFLLRRTDCFETPYLFYFKKHNNSVWPVVFVCCYCCLLALEKRNFLFFFVLLPFYDKKTAKRYLFFVLDNVK